MKIIKNFIENYKAFIAYGFFGVLTTIINIVSYNLCYNRIGLNNTVSNILAWVLAVTVAYITNKIWVFESKCWQKEEVLREVLAFVSCRVATGIMDLVIMYICVDIMEYHALLMKMISNILVIVLNYIFSKLIIFKKK